MLCTYEDIKQIFPDLERASVNEGYVTPFWITPSYKLERHIDVWDEEGLRILKDSAPELSAVGEDVRLEPGIFVSWLAVYDPSHRKSEKIDHDRIEVPLVAMKFLPAENGKYKLEGYDFRFGHDLDQLAKVRRANAHIQKKHENVLTGLNTLAQYCDLMFAEAMELEVYFRAAKFANLSDANRKKVDRARGSLVKRLMDLYPEKDLPNEVVNLKQLGKKPPPRPKKPEGPPKPKRPPEHPRQGHLRLVRSDEEPS